MKQVIVIHGGDSFDRYEDYLNDLRSKDFDLDRLNSKDWKSNLQEELGDEYQVIKPKMPNAQNARYLEWKIVFENLLKVLDKDLILIGHSLGGIFLIKYLSENNIEKNIESLHLVAAPFATKDHSPITDFNIQPPLKLSEQVKKIFLYHSTDDPVVPYGDVKYYSREFPDAILNKYFDQHHFIFDNLPGLKKNITNN